MHYFPRLCRMIAASAVASVSFALPCLPGQADAHAGNERLNARKNTWVGEMDNYHKAISHGVVNMANRIDAFFADDRVLEESEDTQVRVRSAVRYEDGKNLTLRISLQGRFTMPHMRDRFQLIFDTDERERDIKDELRETPDVTDDDRSVSTGIRYILRQTRRSRVNLDGGLRWRGGPVPFARIRGRRTLTYEHWAVRFTQLFFWFEDRGFGERTTVDFERWLDDTHFFRATPSMTWSETSRGVDLKQSVSIFHFLSEDTMLGFSLSADGYTRPSAKVDTYAATFRWRQRSHRDWMYYEIAPSLAFPRENDFEFTPILTLKLEVLFGNPR